jgi:hypothetical protein
MELRPTRSSERDLVLDLLALGHGGRGFLCPLQPSLTTKPKRRYSRFSWYQMRYIGPRNRF